MEVQPNNADHAILKVATSIGRAPQSWKGWSCLYIELSNIDKKLYQDCQDWAKNLIESYLQTIEGRAYFCENKTIHILCKECPHDILNMVAEHILTMLHKEDINSAGFMIFPLNTEGRLYAHNIIEQLHNYHGLCIDAYHDSITNPYLQEMPAAHDPANERAKVLLVEDDPVTRWMVRNTLKNECEFSTAPTAHKAFDMYTACQPDVVFLDINLPDDNGHNILKWMIRHDPGACVVMFSSNNDLDNISSALDNGASGFIAKPFLKGELLHYIETL